MQVPRLACQAARVVSPKLPIYPTVKSTVSAPSESPNLPASAAPIAGPSENLSSSPSEDPFSGLSQQPSDSTRTRPSKRPGRSPPSAVPPVG